MKILVLTFYFTPDLCAGSFRNTAFVKALKEKLSDKDTIDVITTMPNRYSSFKESAPEFEQDGIASIHRIRIPQHKSGLKDQILSFQRYYRKASRLVKRSEYDLIFASSSRLFTAFLGSRISKRKKAPLYLDIRDIFTENIKEVVSSKIFQSIGIPFLKHIEKMAFSRATHINLVSEGFSEYFKQFNSPKTFFTNGIDDEFINLEATGKKNSENSESPLTITYAGNIGDGQGLDMIIPQAASKLVKKVKFVVIGDGGAKTKLAQKLQHMGVRNVVLLPPQHRTSLIDYYLNSDFLFLHLNDYRAFELVLPSKIFEYGAMGKRIIAGVKGFARRFIEEHLPDSILFEPGDHEQLCEKLSLAEKTCMNRSAFIDKFARANIMSRMADSLLSLTASQVR